MSRKLIVESVNDAFATGKTEGFLERCAADVVWTVVGDRTARGKAAVRAWIAEGAGCDPPKFTVTRMIEDGDTVVCYGDMTMSAKSEESSYSYCDIYEFGGDEIKRLLTFVVKQTEK